MDIILKLLWLCVVISLGCISIPLIIAITSKKPIALLISLAGIISLAFSVFLLNKYTTAYNDPGVTYQRLKDNLSNADKELRKFYIDHPEFEGQ